MNKNKIKEKTEQAIMKQLYERGYATCVDSLVIIGWLQPKSILEWRNGRIPYLERVCCTNLSHLNTFLRCYMQFAKDNEYSLRWTCYQRKKKKVKLYFTRNHEENIERCYAMHIVCMSMKGQNLKI